MYLLLMRHGIAEDGEPDEERRLTGKGRRRVEMMAQLLGRFGLRPDVILTSNRVRAIQTAKIVAETLELDADIERTEAVDFDASWNEFAAMANTRCAAAGDDSVVLVVGHQPQIGMLVRMATEGIDDAMEIKKGGCAGLRFKGEFAPGKGELRFYLTPSLAKRI